METADHHTASFPIVVDLLEEMSRDKTNYKLNLNHSVFVEKCSLARVCNETRKARHRNLGSIPGGVTDLSGSQSLQTGYGPSRDLSPEVKEPTRVDNHTPPSRDKVLRQNCICLHDVLLD